MFQFLAFYFYYCLFSMSFYYITERRPKEKTLLRGTRDGGRARLVQFLITRILPKTNKMIIMEMLEPVSTSYYKTYALKPWKIKL